MQASYLLDLETYSSGITTAKANKSTIINADFHFLLKRLWKSTRRWEEILFTMYPCVPTLENTRRKEIRFLNCNLLLCCGLITFPHGKYRKATKPWFFYVSENSLKLPLNHFIILANIILMRKMCSCRWQWRLEQVVPAFVVPCEGLNFKMHRTFKSSAACNSIHEFKLCKWKKAFDRAYFRGS